MSTNTTPTAARVYSSDGAHFYYPNGQPAHTVIAKGTGQPRNVTLADARKLNLVPSVTTYLKILDKPGLNYWKTEQACLAVLTAPRKDGEELDAFVQRVLQVEEQHEQEAEMARDFGTDIHEAMEMLLSGRGDDVTAELLPWIQPAAEAITARGARYVVAEKILVGDGFAGKTDLITEDGQAWWLWDYKSTKKLPDPAKGGAWKEHRLQLAAYAGALEKTLAATETGGMPIRTANIYISSVEQGKFVICEHDPDWKTVFVEGFLPLVQHWQWDRGFKPVQ